jgi:hypothetical protein
MFCSCFVSRFPDTAIHAVEIIVMCMINDDDGDDVMIGEGTVRPGTGRECQEVQ